MMPKINIVTTVCFNTWLFSLRILFEPLDYLNILLASVHVSKGRIWYWILETTYKEMKTRVKDPICFQWRKCLHYPSFLC